MNIITVSRQFGSGGRELAKRMADILNYDYYDNEILSELAHKKGMDESYVSSVLTGGTKNVAVTFGRSFAGTVAASKKTELLVAQKEIIENIAAQERNCIIVGRCADVILKDKKPLNIFVCADIDARIDRCVKREVNSKKVSRKDFEKQILAIDRERARVRAVMSSGEWGNPLEYDLVINSTDREIKRLAAFTAQFAKGWFGK